MSVTSPFGAWAGTVDKNHLAGVLSLKHPTYPVVVSEFVTTSTKSFGKRYEKSFVRYSDVFIDGSKN